MRRAAAASVASARVAAAGVLSDELQRMRETAVACGGSIESVRAFENAIAAVRRVRATSIVATASLATESTVVGEAAFSKQLLEHLQQARELLHTIPPQQIAPPPI